MTLLLLFGIIDAETSFYYSACLAYVAFGVVWICACVVSSSSLLRLLMWEVSIKQ